MEYLERKLKKDNVPVASVPILEVEEPLPKAVTQQAIAEQISLAGAVPEQVPPTPLP